MIDLKKIQRSGVLQHDSSDCGTACLVTLIRFFGGESTIGQIRNLSGTDQSGTTMLGLLQAAEKTGFDATGYEAEIPDIIKYSRELILHVRLENGFDHYVVWFGYENDKFIIWDPAKGLQYLSEHELSKLWESRKCLGVIPNSKFIRRKSRRDLIFRWLVEKIKPDKNILTVSLIAGIAISILSMVMAVFTQKLIDDILPSKDNTMLAISLLLLFILLVAKALLGYVRQLMLLSQGKTFNIRIIDDFFGLFLNLPKPFFDTRKKGDFIGRLNDTMRIQRVITEFVSIYLIDLMIVIFSLVFLFIYSSFSALISIIFLPVLFLVIYRWNKKIIDSQREVMAMYANTESNYIDSLGGITEIKSLQWQDHFKSRNKTIFSEFQERIFNLGKIKVSLGLIAGIAGILYLVLILSITSVFVFRSRITTGELLAILSICSGILPSLLNLSLIAIPLSEVKVALSRMFEFTQTDPESDIPINAPVGIENIRLRDISFRFPGRSLLLKKINIQLQKGTIVSLTGESGCGKSTIAGIIMRFYEAEDGTIVVNHGIDSNKIPINNWRSKVIIIPQEIHIFNGTILQNILTDPTEDKLKDLVSVINEFGLVRFYDSFPSGLLTLVGEDGLSLSGGQKQIIAFTRAIIKKPDFLIIDEGTSSLDRQSEQILIKIIQSIKRDTGILMITHKGELIKEISDENYILENGILSCISVNRKVGIDS
jgi:ATP-binding cassette subfamily B protein